MVLTMFVDIWNSSILCIISILYAGNIISKMPILEKSGIITVLTIETLTLFIPLLIFLRKFLEIVKRSSFRKNPAFRFLNILLLMFTLTNTFVALLKTVGYLDDNTDLKYSHAFLEHFWHFLYTIILTQTMILIKMTILRTERRPTNHLIKLQYVHLFPLVIYTTLIPYKLCKCDPQADQDTLKKMRILEKLGILVNSCYNLCNTLLLTKYFMKVLRIIDNEEINSSINKKRIQEWKRFMKPVILSGYLHVIIALTFLIMTLKAEKVPGTLKEENYRIDSKGIVIYLMKVFTSVILVILNPHSMTKRENNTGK